MSEAARQDLVYFEDEDVSRPDVWIPTTIIKVQPDGYWHRRGPISHLTACGLHYQACQVREYEINNELCESCFTDFERSLVGKVSTGGSP